MVALTGIEFVSVRDRPPGHQSLTSNRENWSNLVSMKM